MRYSRKTGAALILGIGSLALGVCRSEPREPTLADLLRALGDRRPIEARLTGGFAYAPCKVVVEDGRLLPRAVCSEAPKAGTRAFRVLARLQRSAGRSGSAESLHVAGVALLVAGSDSPTGKAVQLLERSAEAKPSDARILNDLAAAYLARAGQQDNPEDLVRGLDVAARAVNVDASLPEARFNLGLALDQLFLTRSAIAAWEDYAELDSRSPWAKEGLRRVRALQQPSIPERWQRELPTLEAAALRGDTETVRRIVEIAPQLARETAVEGFLGEWGKAAVAQPEERTATDHLVRARTVGDALFERTGDPTVRDAVDAIERSRTDFFLTASLARGHIAFAEAMLRFRLLKTDAALELFQQAADSLAGSPIELWARVGEVRCLAYAAQYSEAESLYPKIIARAEESHYWSLAGWSYWGLGWIRSARQAKTAEALGHFIRAEDNYRRTAEIENRATLLGFLGDGYHALGQSRTSWDYRYRALEALQDFPVSWRLHIALMYAAEAAVGGDQTNAGLLLQEEGLAAAEAAQDPTRLAEAHWARSRILLLLDRHGEARQEAEAAAAFAYKADIGQPRRKVLADVALTQAQVLTKEEPQVALERFTNAISSFRALQARPAIAYASLLQSRLLKSMHRYAEAERDLRAAIEILDDPSAQALNSDLQISFTETLQAVYDEWVAALLDRHRDASGALATVERARSLPPRPSVKGTESLFSTHSLTTRIPRNAIVVEYTVLATRLAVFVIDRTGIEVFEHKKGEREVATLVERFSQDLEGGEEPGAISMELYTLLIPDVVRKSRGRTIFFIPDKALHRIPFAALQNPTTRRFLIQDNPVALVSSLASALAHTNELATGSLSGLKALLVERPYIDRVRFPELAELPQAPPEVAEALRIFPGPTILRGTAATKRGMLEALGAHQVLIFSGHSVLNAAKPSESYLVVAPEKGDESAGVLMGKDLLSRDLKNLKLVVLSSCESFGPRNARVAGFAGVARFFSEGGAEAVVGSLWRVEDREAAMVLRDFWSCIASGASAVKALQEAQLRHVATMRPRAWAAFSIVVGNF